VEERTTHSDWTDRGLVVLVDPRQLNVKTEHQTHLKASLSEREKLRMV